MSGKREKQNRKLRQAVNEQAVVLFLELLKRPLWERIKYAWYMLIGKRKD